MIPCGSCGSYALSRSSQRHQPTSLNLRHDEMASSRLVWTAIVIGLLTVASVVALSVTVGVYGKEVIDFINRHESAWYNTSSTRDDATGNSTKTSPLNSIVSNNASSTLRTLSTNVTESDNDGQTMTAASALRSSADVLKEVNALQGPNTNVTGNVGEDVRQENSGRHRRSPAPLGRQGSPLQGLTLLRPISDSPSNENGVIQNDLIAESDDATQNEIPADGKTRPKWTDVSETQKIVP
ncbi:hypothetical protein BIW11_13095 [Tropilaelaps mercedesae]|uniref:Transmembrane protein n=1 Tax=Tropilaelaps mercedesae TaxID=418985 RepID=A0A1V9X3K1_9ACAR|nr:hypothetical protein BIW11_13095 [Tropilaelaps mercedesae]